MLFFEKIRISIIWGSYPRNNSNNWNLNGISSNSWVDFTKIDNNCNYFPNEVCLWLELELELGVATVWTQPLSVVVG